MPRASPFIHVLTVPLLLKKPARELLHRVLLMSS